MKQGDCFEFDALRPYPWSISVCCWDRATELRACSMVIELLLGVGKASIFRNLLSTADPSLVKFPGNVQKVQMLRAVRCAFLFDSFKFYGSLSDVSYSS